MLTQPDGADPRLDELLLRWEELHEQGRTLTPDELCSTCPELAPELARRIGLLCKLDPLLGKIQTDCGVPASAAPARPQRRQSATVRAEYRNLRFHAAGALGEVFLARNAELNRDVALKFLKPGRQRDATSLRRFLQEAEVTGRLEHPGVVPIYGLGTDPSGAPCYAMRLIRGETLQEAIDAFHAAERPGRDPSERSLALRELLSRFVSVCNTVAYAHSRGILHRDLKPRNVMLGRYDETLLVDWGLAKPFERSVDQASDSAEEPVTPSSGSGSDTPTVGLVGTLAYMSPEQGHARWDQVGPASDIFGLGAILYAILTSRPPYLAAHRADVLELVKRAEFPRPRQIKPEVPPALEAICQKAMSATPVDRYATAQDLAADVKRWLAGEPVTAYPEPLAACLRRWVRRHQRPVIAMTAAALVAAVASLVFATLISASNRRLMAANLTIRQKNAEITRQNRELEKTNKRLLDARTEAEQERDKAQEATEFLVSSFRKPDPAQDGRTVTVAAVLGPAVIELEGRTRMAPATRATILSAVCRTFRGLGLFSEHVEVAKKVLAMRQADPSDSHFDTLTAMTDLALAYRDAGQSGRAIPLYDQAYHTYSAELGENHPETLFALHGLGAAHVEVGEFDHAIALLEPALRGQRQTLGSNHLHTLTSMVSLASACEAAGQLDRAIALFDEALKGHRAALGDDHPETLGALGHLGVAYGKAGRQNRAIPLLEQALSAMQTKLGEGHPDTLRTMHTLAVAYEETGQLERSIPLKEQALRAFQSKLGADHPETLIVVNNLAVAYLTAGLPDRAIPLLEQSAKAQQQKLGRDHPATLGSLANLAVAYRSAGRLDRAIPLLEKTQKALEAKLGGDHPTTLRSLANLAAGYRDAGQLNRAIPLLEQTAKTQTAKQGPEHPATLSTQRNLGEAYQRARRDTDAERLFQQVVDSAARSEPRNDRFYSDSLAMLGSCLIIEHRYEKAVSILQECLAIREKIQKDSWPTADARSLLGEALAGQKQFGQAEPLLLAGQKGLFDHPDMIPASRRDATLRAAVERLVRLYDAWNRPATAEEWKKRLLPQPAQSPRSATEKAPHAPAPTPSTRAR
jgi:serine/threonine protein kinase/tetratricopeptide (TPR) repeat protein